MRKCHQWLVIITLISCSVSFITCDEANQIVKPAIPGTDSEVVEDDALDTTALQNSLTIEGAKVIGRQLPVTSTAETAPTIQADVGQINASPGDTISLPFEYSGTITFSGCIVCIEGVDGYFDLPYTGAADALPSAISATIPQDAALGSFTVCYGVYDTQDQYSNFLTAVVNVTAPEVIEPEPPVVVDPTESPPEDMVLIPAGEFLMGDDSGEFDYEKPAHTVYVDAFYMDKYEVTNEQYAEFLNTKGKHTDTDKTWLGIEHGIEFSRVELVNGVYRVKAGYENHPVGYVSWYGAMAYAEWAGKRLPTEAEWEKAARGGLVGKKYSNGNTITLQDANYDYWNGVQDSTPVGSYPANGYGLYDMTGNMWEWCLDEFDANFYSISPERNPLSGADSIQWLIDNYREVDTKRERVLRGASWDNHVVNVRITFRFRAKPTITYGLYGFRCARSVSD